MKSPRTWKPLAAGMAVLVVAAVAVLAGAAGSGRAATGIDVQLSPLIGSGQNVIQEVSPGGNIGYQLLVRNSGDSNVAQVTIAVTSDVATYVDSAVSDSSSVSPVCAGSGTSLTCTPPAGKLSPGDQFTIFVRFRAPAVAPPTDEITTRATVTVAARTVGGSQTNGTSTTSSDPVVTATGAASVDSLSTFARGNESSQTGQLGTIHPQRFQVSLPSSLLGDTFGVALSLADQSAAPICPSCLSWLTKVTIPLASQVTNVGNPFYDGTANPYTWTMQSLYPAGFKPSGVAYLDDTGVLHFPLPACGGGAPSVSAPVCVDTLVQDKKTKILTATGRGIENGNFGFG
jgi:hypothetical protein